MRWSSDLVRNKVNTALLCWPVSYTLNTWWMKIMHLHSSVFIIIRHQLRCLFVRQASGIKLNSVFLCSYDRWAEGSALHKETAHQRGVRGQTECDPQGGRPRNWTHQVSRVFPMDFSGMDEPSTENILINCSILSFLGKKDNVCFIWDW